VTIVREPLDRIVSVFDHHRNWPGTGGIHEWINAEGVTLDRFVSEGRTPAVDNSMVRYLSGMSAPIGRCTDEMLDVAKRNLDSCAAVLVQDDMGPGIRELARVVRTDLASLPRANVSPARLDRDEIPREVAKRVLDLNRFDGELYRHARERGRQPLEPPTPPGPPQERSAGRWLRGLGRHLGSPDRPRVTDTSGVPRR
jgi:hypothetical protein